MTEGLLAEYRRKRNDEPPGMCAEYRLLLMKLVAAGVSKTITTDLLNEAAHAMGFKNALMVLIVQRQQDEQEEAESEEDIPF